MNTPKGEENKMKTYILITKKTQYHITAKNLLDLYRKILKLKLDDNDILEIDESTPLFQWEDFLISSERNKVHAVQVS